MDRTVVPVALSHPEKVLVKPAMAGQRAPASAPVSAVPASQGLRPVDPVKRPLPSVLGVKLSHDLRGRIASAAAQEGISDSAWLRQRALDALGLESAVDAASGPRPRIPPEEQAVLAGVLRDLGALYEPLGRASVPVEEVKAGLDRIRAAVMPIVIGLGRS